MECKNCNQQLQESDQFCNMCGAKVIDHRLTFGSLFTEIRERIFNLDSNKPLHTFLDLFLRPQKVIDGYIRGVRKRYINPFGYLTIAITVFGAFLFFFSEEYSAAISSISSASDNAEPQAELGKKINDNVLKYQSFIFFLFVPFLALVSKIVFLKNKKYNYVEHIIINTYGQAHISLASTILYFATVWHDSAFSMLTVSITFINVLYFAYMLKMLYGLSFLGIILKTLLFAVILIPLFIIIIIITWVLLIITGTVSVQDLIDAEKAKQGVSYIASSVINWTS